MAMLLASWSTIALAGPATSDPAAFKLYAREVVLAQLDGQDRFKPAFESADAASFVRPYDPKTGKDEKAARAAWYSAQLPAKFPKSGPVRVLYLYPCQFPASAFEDAEPGDIMPSETAVADQLWVQVAMEREGIQPPSLAAIVRPDAYERDHPVPGVKQLNEQLAKGSTVGRAVVLEPYCGTVHSEMPPPPPPPPEREAIHIRTTPGTSVFIASKMYSELCRLKTGSAFNLGCQYWTEALSNTLELGGRLYRYVITKAKKPIKTGEFDLNRLSGAPDDPIRLTAD